MSITRLFTRRTTTMSIWRAAAISGGKGAGLAEVTASATFKLWPASQAPALIAAIPEIAAARAAHIAAMLSAVDVRLGDELRSGTTKYKVSGRGAWSATVFVALEEVKP